MSRKLCVLFVFLVFGLTQVSLFMSVNDVNTVSTNGKDIDKMLRVASILKSTPQSDEALRVFRDVLRTNSSDQNETSQCLLDLEAVLRGVFNSEVWAIKMIDASSKIPSGLLDGNIVDLGEFDECIRIGTSSTPSDIQGQHCLISLNIHLNSSFDLGGQGTSDALGNGLTLTFAWCLPKSCALDEIRDALKGLSIIINEFVPAGDNVTLTVDPTDCHLSEQSDLTAAEWYALGICLILAVLTVLSTTYDWITDKNRSTSLEISLKEKLFLSFSVLSNGRKILSTSSSVEFFPVLNCLKVLSIFWVLVGHKFRFVAENPVINLLELPDVLKYVSCMLLLNAPLSVDVFFIVSALLATYGYLKSGYGKRATVAKHISSIIRRYLRLSPAYALMILFTSTWLYRMGDGPIWDRLVGHARNQCEVNWWSGLLYINNYYNPDESCMMQSWYLAADMQLYLFAPLVLYPLLKWPRWGLTLLAICGVFSVAIPFYVAYSEEIKAPLAISRNTERVRRETDALYLPTHTKTISYVTGIFLGYILFQIKERKKEFRLKKMTNIIIWILAIIILLASLFGCYPFFQLDTPYNKWESSLYIGFYRLGWSIGIAWIIIACSTGHGGCITTFVSWKVFGPLGRLTYCVYLVHVAVILVGLGRMRNPQYYDTFNILTTCFGEFILSLFFGIILTLVMESPLMAIERIILPREPRTRRSEIELPRSITPRNVGSSQRIRTGQVF